MPVVWTALNKTIRMPHDLLQYEVVACRNRVVSGCLNNIGESNEQTYLVEFRLLLPNVN